MPKVYPLGRLIYLLVRESLRHVGAAATAAALRESLSIEGLVDTEAFDRSFAASRLTPGTNLIALFAALGRIVAGPIGAFTAVVVGILPAALVTVGVCILYLNVGQTPTMERAIEGASAAAWAVLVWSAGRFLVGPLRTHWKVTLALTVGTVTFAVLGVPVVALLAMSALVGSVTLQPARP